MINREAKAAALPHWPSCLLALVLCIGYPDTNPATIEDMKSIMRSQTDSFVCLLCLDTVLDLVSYQLHAKCRPLG